MARRLTQIGGALRKAIDVAGESGVSRYRISKDTGVEQSALSRFMSGERGLDLVSVEKLAEYLGLELVKKEASQKEGR
jgi:transcriptional regulator with XRE-family HTH domain